MLRQRDQLATAFGRNVAYASLGYTELDAVAVQLAEVLTEKLDRALVGKIVRDQWGVWTRVVAVAEAKPSEPVFLYVIEFESKKGERGIVTVGSMLDSGKESNLREIAMDLQKRAGIVAKHFVAVEMQQLLAEVRSNAKAAGFDFSDKFLPPYGDPWLEEILKPFDDPDTPDQAIPVTAKAKEREAERARRAGILSRATVEAAVPAIPRSRELLQ